MPDGVDSLTYHLPLLEFAAHMIKANPKMDCPQLHEILHFDRDWTMQVYTMLETIRYAEDNPIKKGQENGN